MRLIGVTAIARGGAALLLVGVWMLTIAGGGPGTASASVLLSTSAQAPQADEQLFATIDTDLRDHMRETGMPGIAVGS